jgi:hypothetical protein
MLSKRHGGLVSIRAKLFVSLRINQKKNFEPPDGWQLHFSPSFGYSAPWPEFQRMFLGRVYPVASYW